MSRRLLLGIVCVLAISFFFGVNAFSQSKGPLHDELDEIKADYYAKKYDIDNQIREIGKEWHMYQLQMHERIKANPEQARAIRAELWEGAKELSQKKKAIYKQLTPLRKSWYRKRMDLEAKLANIDEAEESQWD